MIKHKAYSVPDSVCEGCSQLYEGECRAFTVPHSPDETEHRAGGAMNCRPIRGTCVACSNENVVLVHGIESGTTFEGATVTTGVCAECTRRIRVVHNYMTGGDR